MKLNTRTLFATIAAGAIALTASCKDGHDHAHNDHDKEESHTGHDHDKDDHSGHDHDKDEHAECAVKIGPNNGRILKKSGAEFFITADGKVKFFFLDKEGKTTAPAIDSITFLIGSDSVELKKEGNSYVSAPMKDKLNGKATVKIKANGKSATDKFDISLEKCGDCDNAEYKCTCHEH